jgi:hypothetical protein
MSYKKLPNKEKYDVSSANNRADMGYINSISMYSKEN